MKNKIIVLLLILVLCINPIAASSTNWITFQENVEHTGFLNDDSDFVTNLWTHDMGADIVASPAINGSDIFYASQKGILKSIDMETGEENWSLNLGSPTNSSPIIYNNTLYIGCEEGLKAINLEDQKFEWNYSTDESVQSTPFYYNGTIYFGCDNGHLYGLNTTGDKVFNANLRGEIISSPAVVKDSIYVGSTDSSFYCLSLNGSSKWNYTTGDEIRSNPAIFDEKVAFGSNDASLYVLNATNGKLDWKAELDNKVISSPTIDEHDNNLYIGSDGGNMTCLDLRDGHLKWSFNTGSEVQSTAAYKGDLVVFGSNNGNGYVLNKYTGQQEFSYNPGALLFNSEITSSPVIYGNSAFFAGHDGYVYSLNIDKYETPASVFLYYSLVVLIVILFVLILIVRKVKNTRKDKKNKNKK